nr:MAG TPA: hypothetical protein [Caudoviricetes sp.]
MGAKNKVIAGDYKGGSVKSVLGILSISAFPTGVNLDKNTVDDYQLVTDDVRKSASSGVARGIVGGVLLGPVGMLAGGLSAKNKGVYTVAVQFKDGKKSLLELDDKLYKKLVQKIF